jgi:hypothetical protein
MPKGPQNSDKIKVHTEYFEGGMSVDSKVGVPNSYWRSINLDNRTIPSELHVNPGSRTVATNLLDNITAMEQDLAGIRWAVGDKGNIYKIDATNTVSRVGQLSSNGAAGILYNPVSDQLYIPGQQTVSMYGQVVNTATSGPSQLRSDLYAQSASNAAGCLNLFNPVDNSFDLALRSTAASTYTLKTVLSESVGDYCFFAPDIEPFYSIQVKVVNKGTGDWTLTLHDALNNKLASTTVTNANLVNNAYNEFKFSTAGGVRALVNASQTGNSSTYHFHLTSTVGDGTASVVNSGDLTGSDFLLYAYRLVKTNNGWHPTALFTGSGKPLLCIGNGPYLSTYDFSNDLNPNNQQWQRHALVFRPGEEVCGLSNNNQYLVIAVERRSTNTSRNYQRGALYFWDGSTAAPNFVIDIPMGAPHSLYTFNNVTYFVCAGSLYAWSGGQTVIKVRKLAYQNTDYLNAADSTVVNPNMMTSRYSLLEIGYPSTTTNTNIYYGIYSWGGVELTFPNSLVISYTLANGQTAVTGSNALTIGSVYNFVDTMYITWSYFDGSLTRYGIDVVDNFSTPATTARWESLIWDGGVRYKMKRAMRYKINFLALPTGVTVTPIWSIDRAAYTSADPVTGLNYTAVAGDVSIMVEFNNARFHEIQWGFIITSTAGVAVSPGIVTGVTMEIDTLEEESNLKKDTI